MPESSSHRDPNRAPSEVPPSTPIPLTERRLLFQKPRDLSQKKVSTLFLNLRWGLLLVLKPWSSGWLYSNSPASFKTHSRPSGGHWRGACPKHQLDHGVRDPICDHCKRELGPLYRHNIKGNRHLPVFTFDFSGPHPHRANAAQHLLVCVQSLGDMRLVWAFGVENRPPTLSAD